MLRAALALLAFARPASGCELALLLALDISGSVDPQDFALQRDGLALALADPVIADALAEHDAEVAVLQWSGLGRQRVTIPWRRIETPADAVALSAAVSADKRAWSDFSTAVGEALDLAADAFELVPQCRRRVIDISGDGRSNEGRPPAAIWPRLAALDITVNALVIRGVEPFLFDWYVSDVLTGPGAFALEAAGYRDYPRAIRAKLERETVLQLASQAP